MLRITPCRNTVSERFPVASWIVDVPRDRVFEIACATRPELLRAEHRAHRTPANFFTTRAGGLLRAPAGQATYLLPPEQLRRFAGQRRLYFTLGSYSGPRGEQAAFTTPPDRAHEAPFLQLSPDFTGRSLDRSRLARARELDPRYGAPGAPLAWGGDVAGADAPPSEGYDDGYPGELWSAGATAPAPEADGAALADPPESDPDAQVSDTWGARRGEPAGFEDAPALRTAGRSGRPLAAGSATSAASAAPPRAVERAGAVLGGAAPAQPGDEPAGTEHPAAPGRRWGDGAPARDLEPSTAAPEGPPGVDDAWAEQLGADPEGELPVTVPAAALDAEGPRPLTLEEKYRLILVVAEFESGADGYSAVNPDSEFNDPRHPFYHRVHVGLSWGLIQATQRGGALGRTLLAGRRRSPELFASTFGPASDALLAVTTADGEEARVQPVDGSFLWDEPWLGRFRAAGRVPELQAAQNEIAIEDYLDANLPFAAAIGLDTERALAMLYDRCVNMGNRAGREFVLSAISPIVDDATRDRALAAVGAPSVRALQERLGLRADGIFGPKTHAGLVGALRQLGDQVEPALVIPPLPALLDRLVEASRGRRFERRMSSLQRSDRLADLPRQVP